MPVLAARTGELGTESAFEVLARAKALEARGRDVLHLEIGEPDFPTPAHVLEAAVAALRAGETRYVQSAGLPALREALAEDIRRRRGVALDPGRVVVTTGAKAVLFYTVLAVVEPGDEVLLPDPGFPIYASAVRFAGGRPVPVPLRPESGFRLTADDLAERIGPRTRLLILNSPGNPTGTVLPRAELERIAELAERHDLWVLSDEIYQRLAYGPPPGPAPSFYAIPGLDRRTVLLDGFSKTYAMTGWRLGYAALPEPLVEPFVRLVVNSTSCVPPFVQAAGLAALDGGEDSVRAMRAEFARRRDFLVQALARIPGIACAPPEGAFYVFADVRALGRPSAEFADLLLEREGVAVLPGTCFGPGGEGFVRISYAAGMEVLQEAVERLARLAADLRRG
jgi:aspartate aminotransferase